MITVADKPVALAGVMGRLQKSLKSLLVWFLKRLFSMAKSIRKTSGRLNLRSESSSRFEKGINVATISQALDTWQVWIAELASATVRGEHRFSRPVRHF